MVSSQIPQSEARALRYCIPLALALRQHNNKNDLLTCLLGPTHTVDVDATRLSTWVASAMCIGHRASLRPSLRRHVIIILFSHYFWTIKASCNKKICSSYVSYDLVISLYIRVCQQHISVTNIQTLEVAYKKNPGLSFVFLNITTLNITTRASALTMIEERFPHIVQW